MIKIVYEFSEKQRNDIINHFGIEFYNKVNQDLLVYSKKWQLHQFTFIPSYSINCVFKCYSDQYGDSILKIGKPNKESLTEVHALKEFNGKRFCQIYDFDIENGIILEEQIKPGTVLWEVTSLEERLNLFSSLYNGLYIEPENQDIYLTYLNWVSRITDYMSQRPDCLELYSHMKRAKELCVTLSKTYSKNLLLHGDLHHENILLGINNQYKIIDPKGVIGDPIFDIGQFMINEYDHSFNQELFHKFNQMISHFETSLQIPNDVIRKCLYIQTAMSDCWNVEDGAFQRLTAVRFAEQLLEEK